MYLLATLWIWNAVAYHALLFTNINPAAWLFTGLFTIEGVLLFWAAARRRIEPVSLTGPISGLGIALACYALAYPFLSTCCWRQASHWRDTRAGMSAVHENRSWLSH